MNLIAAWRKNRWAVVVEFGARGMAVAVAAAGMYFWFVTVRLFVTAGFGAAFASGEFRLLLVCSCLMVAAHAATIYAGTRRKATSGRDPR